jgi:YD repeat-containing protein
VDIIYDGYRNPIYYYDELGRQTTTLYNALGQLWALIEPDPGTGQHGMPITLYQYDAAGNVTYVSDPRGNVTEYQYDAMNRVKIIIPPSPGGDPDTPAAAVTQYEYDANGNLRREIVHLDGNSSSVASTDRVAIRDYDARNLVQKLTLSAPFPGGAPANVPADQRAIIEQQPVVEYRYDTLGNLAFETDVRGLTDGSGATIKTKYEYDKLGRTTRIIYPSSSDMGHASPVRAYHYKAAGQLEQVYGDSTVVTRNYYDKLDRLIAIDHPDGSSSEPGLITLYAYDDSGDLQRELAASRFDPRAYLTADITDASGSRNRCRMTWRTSSS